MERGPGATVTGGTRNGAGALVVRVDTVAAESVLARLQRLVDEAQRDKPPIQRLADRISAVFVPVVLLLAAGDLLRLVDRGRQPRDRHPERAWRCSSWRVRAPWVSRPRWP